MATLRCAVAALAAAVALAATTCSFAENTLNCVALGGNCCANNGQYITMPSVSGGSYTPTSCHVKFGDGTRECGTSYEGPTLDAVYGSVCSNDPITSPYPCQYTDPTQLGEEQYPDLLQCDRWLNKCVLEGTQVAGDPCTASNECVSGLCRAGVCAGLPVGSKCTPGGCAPGVYCHITANDTGTCRANIAPGHNCGMLAACGVGYVCNLAAPQATCQAVFSQPNGVVVNTPDLCASGITDDAGKCTSGLPDAQVGAACDSTAQPPSTAICACARDNTYRLRPHTLRSARMAAARKAARQCFASAKAPDGTPCSDPWANIGVGRRLSEIGTCGWYTCHAAIMAYEASEADLIAPPLSQFDHDPACGQAGMNSYFAAAGSGQIGCYLPAAFAANGWSCASGGAPSGMTGGQKFGVAVAIMLPLGLVGYAAFALYTGRAPAWLKGAWDKTSAATSAAYHKVRGAGAAAGGTGSYGRIGTAGSSSSASAAFTSSSSSSSYGSAPASAPAASAYTSIGSSGSGYQ